MRYTTLMTLKTSYKTKRNNSSFYPASFRRPYQIMEADATSVLQRTEVINSLDKQRKKVIVITYPEAIIEKVIDRSSLNKQCISLQKEEQIDLDFLNEMLIELQFEKVDYVYEPGQFAVRGGILDVYSFGHEYPFRIEFLEMKSSQLESLILKINCPFIRIRRSK